MHLSLLFLLKFTFTVGQKHGHGHLLQTCSKSRPWCTVSVGKELFLVLCLSKWRGPGQPVNATFILINALLFYLCLMTVLEMEQSSDPNPVTSQYWTLNRYLPPTQSTYLGCLVWLAQSAKSFILAFAGYPEMWLLCVDTEIHTVPTVWVNLFFWLPWVDSHLLHREL